MIWKVIPSFPYYEASNTGEIRRATPAKGATVGKIVFQHINKDGRPSVTLSGDGKKVTFRVCRLVCEAFHGPPTRRKNQACHRDGNSANNRADNLRWGSPKSNASDTLRHGTRRWGENHPNSRLTLEQVRDIRRRSKRGERKRAIAEDYSIHPSHVSRLVGRKSWRGSSRPDK